MVPPFYLLFLLFTTLVAAADLYKVLDRMLDIFLGYFMTLILTSQYINLLRRRTLERRTNASAESFIQTRTRILVQKTSLSK